MRRWQESGTPALLGLASCWAGDSSRSIEGTQSDSATDHSAIDIWCGPHSEALVVDPNGRRIGFDVATGQSYQEIPNAGYSSRYIENPLGLSGPDVRYLRIYRPVDGEYRLTVEAIPDPDDSLYEAASASIECHYPNITRASAGRNFRGMIMDPGAVHSFTISFDRSPDAQCSVTGGFEGGGESASIDRLLSYVNIAGAKNTLPPGTDSTDLFIIYGDPIEAESFTATLNGQDLSSLFTPVAGGHEVVWLPVAAGKNVLVLSVRGSAGDKGAVDTDELEFTVK